MIAQRFKLATVQSEEGRQISGFYGLSTSDYDTMLYIDGEELFTQPSDL